MPSSRLIAIAPFLAQRDPPVRELPAVAATNIPEIDEAEDEAVPLKWARQVHHGVAFHTAFDHCSDLMGRAGPFAASMHPARRDETPASFHPLEVGSSSESRLTDALEPSTAVRACRTGVSRL